MEKITLDFEIENELRSNLGSDDKLLWTGRPKKGIRFRTSDIFLIPFSCLWAGFAVFWESSVVSSGAPFFFMIWGIPFLLVSCYITVGRFFVDARKRANTIYGITKDHVIIKSGIFSQEVKSLNIKALSDISIHQKTDGSGTITFGSSDFRSTFIQGIEWPGVKHAPAIEMIEDVRSAYDIIIQMQKRG